MDKYLAFWVSLIKFMVRRNVYLRRKNTTHRVLKMICTIKLYCMIKLNKENILSILYKKKKKN